VLVAFFMGGMAGGCGLCLALDLPSCWLLWELLAWPWLTDGWLLVAGGWQLALIGCLLTCSYICRS
jgi:hypothetical protein